MERPSHNIEEGGEILGNHLKCQVNIQESLPKSKDETLSMSQADVDYIHYPSHPDEDVNRMGAHSKVDEKNTPT